ncbi:MAG: hypothetical protein ACFCVC_03540 [Acidimicrobiia bacterium]
MREPFVPVVRLKGMRSRFVRVAALSLALMLAPSTALAQEAGYSMETTVGIDSWVSARGAILVDVVITADILVSGSLLITYGGSSTEVLVDVPAGGEKTYRIPVRSATRNGNVVVTLSDRDDNRLARDTVGPQVAMEEVLVGADDEQLAATLSAVQTAIDSQPVVAVPIDPGTDRSLLSALGYVVTDEPSEQVWDWVEDGGRVVTTSRALEASTLPLQPIGTSGQRLEAYTFGAGEVVVALDGLAAIDWSSVLRPVPIHLVPNDTWGTVENSLVQAATNSGDGGLADLPWLPFAMVSYLIAVGPFNLWILKRVGKRDWAWLTIPLVSMVALAGFWMAGRQRLDSTALRHATVVVDGEDQYQRSMVVVAAGSAREYRIGVPGASEYVVADVASVFGGGPGISSATGSITEQGVGWDLPKLGVGAFQATAPAEDVLDVEVTSTAGAVSVTVTNRSDVAIDHWGIVSAGKITVASGGLPPGGSDSASSQDSRFDGGMSFGDAVVDQHQLWNDRGYEVISPLGWAGTNEMGPGRPFVFGIASETTIMTEVDGTLTPVEGPTVWMVPLDEVAEPTVGARVGGTLVGLGQLRGADIGQGSPWIDSDRITLSFRGPTDAAEVTFRRGGLVNPNNELEVWNWETGTFETVTLNRTVPVATLMSPRGETVIRVAPNNNGEGLTIDSVWAEYGAGT